MKTAFLAALFAVLASSVAFSFDEARVRYIMADITCGGPLGYYRGFPNDAHALEAVRRWDAGVRVKNGSDFERISLKGKGWTIVYKGTHRAITGEDVILTSDRNVPATK